MYAIPYEYYEKYGVRRYGSTAPATSMSATAPLSSWKSLLSA